LQIPVLHPGQVSRIRRLARYWILHRSSVGDRHRDPRPSYPAQASHRFEVAHHPDRHRARVVAGQRRGSFLGHLVSELVGLTLQSVSLR
jgi:hypothetical protein